MELQASGADIYYWSSDPPDASLNGQNLLINPVVNPQVPSTVYTLTGTDTTTGCTNVSEITVNVKEPVSSNFAVAANEVCSLEELIISYAGNAVPSASYHWDFDNGDANNTGQQNYKVSWSDYGSKIIKLFVAEGGCISDTTKKIVTVNPTPEVDFTAENLQGCEPFTVNFSDSSANTITSSQYLWFFGNGDSSALKNPSYTYKLPGEYTVNLQVNNGDCMNDKSIEKFILVNAAPESDFSLSPTLTSIKDPEINFSDNSSSDVLQWLWDMGDGTIIDNSQNFSHSYQDTGIFVVSLVVENLNGCTDTTYKEVFIKPHPRIFAPNAFNPFSTVGNDKFSVKSTGIERFNMIIYSRWGQKVFETNSISEGWDGNINGKPAPVGTYVYKITYTNNLGQSDEMTGTITLVK